MTFREYLKTNRVYLDGGTGTLLQEAGLASGIPTESWNITHPDEITAVHKAYFDAGCNVVMANTFGINALKYTESEIEENVFAAVNNARRAENSCKYESEKFVALDIGPLGRLLSPLGDLGFEDAVSAFAPVVKAGVKAGADLVFIETMNDSYETKAALLAVKENCDLPVIVSNAYGADGRLMSGATPEVMVALLEGMGADAIGVNCSLGPKALANVVEKYLELSSVPVILKPNAGLPRVENGKTVFDVTPDEFCAEITELVKKGVRCVGGCCGTTPEYIKKVVETTKDIKVSKIEKRTATVVASGTKTADFADIPVLIGERINPTGKKRLKEALRDRDTNYVLNEALREEEAGAVILDVNVGAPEINEKELLPYLTSEIQAVCPLPLQLDTSDPVAMEKAMRIYNGKPLVNSVNGKEESMRAVFPLIKKYGGVAVALTLDEDGIPETADGRVKIAKKILRTAESYGIDRKDVVFDSLTMAVSAERRAAAVTLEALKEIKEKLGCHTLLGVSNVSFGLPERQDINAAFFLSALNSGLSAAIMNPYSAEMMRAYYTWRLIRGIDENCADYIAFANANVHSDINAAPKSTVGMSSAASLKDAVIKGLKTEAAAKAKEMLKSTEPMELVNGEIIPALNCVGADFEAKKVFLPQLLMSAEAAGCAFEEIKAAVKTGDNTKKGENIVLATVKGDIHDIGKNIVKLLLENYGYSVTDLGRDVEPQKIADTVIKLHSPLVGLSALMTTTVPAMEETIKLLKMQAPYCKTVVGGAVLTAEYAKTIGADKYAKDAMETVRYAKEIIG